jgi:group I intron endonuclease
MKISGIYKIQSKIKPKRIYIGSAKNILIRWKLHLRSLRLNKHHSALLQRHYNKYSESDLLFSVLLGCDKEDLIKTEQYFLDSYQPYFNICKIAGSSLGRKHSEESKKKMSESAKKRKDR